MNAQHDAISRSQEPSCDRTDLAVRYPRSRLAAHPTTRTKSATCLDRRWEPGDLGSSGAERGGLARESAAVAFGCSGSRTAPRPALLTR
jgi:hypothetical protein